MKPFIHRPNLILKSCFFCLIFALCLLPSAITQVLVNSSIKATYNSHALTSITCPQDPTHANLLSGQLGNAVVRYKVGNGDWLQAEQDYLPGMPLKMEQTFTLGENWIDYEISIERFLKKIRM